MAIIRGFGRLGTRPDVWLEESKISKVGRRLLLSVNICKRIRSHNRTAGLAFLDQGCFEL